MKNFMLLTLFVAVMFSSCATDREVSFVMPKESMRLEMLRAVADGFYDGDTSKVPRDTPILR
jgi:hypothetical protein